MKNAHKLFCFVCPALGLVLARGSTGDFAGDGNWPREVDRNHFVIYQPQVDSWQKDHLEARSAVIVTRAGAPKPIYGIVSVSARTEVDTPPGTWARSFPTAWLCSARAGSIPDGLEITISVGRGRGVKAFTSATGSAVGRPGFDEVEQLYIDPEECIDCGACVPVCPVSAIFSRDDLPEKWSLYADISASYVKGGQFQADRFRKAA